MNDLTDIRNMYIARRNRRIRDRRIMQAAMIIIGASLLFVIGCYI